MAAEETLRRVGEAVASALGGGETPLPAETPTPTPEPQVDVVQPKKEQFIPAVAEKLQQFAEKITKGVPEAAKKIVRENERPRDARVLSVVSELVSMDEATLADPVSMRRVGERLLTIMADAGPGTPTGEEANKYLQRIVAEHGTLADLRARARQLVGQPGSAVDGLFDESGHDELAGTALEEKLKKYQQFLRYDSGDMHDTHKISEYIAELKRDAYKDNIPEQQVKEAVRRLQDVIGENEQKMFERSGRSELVVRWDEIKNQVDEGIDHEGDPVFQFKYMRPSDAKFLREGREEEWFYSFIDSIYGFSRERAQPSLQDQGKWEDFESFLNWKYGDADAERYLQEYRIHWNERGRHQHVINGLLYQPGDIRDRLRALRLITGADLDYYYKNFEYSNNAATLYEQVVMDLMADRRSRYDESIKWLAERVDFEGKPIARDELYMELKKRNSETIKDPATGTETMGRLSAKDQRRMMEIKSHIDRVGEGVMLWDSDVQSYTEVYLESQKMQQRYEHLLAKRNSGEIGADEVKELGELPDKIERKMAVYKQSRENGEGTRKALNELRGLSPIDIEVRKRLLIYIEEKGLPPPSEYKLRMAIWAARQAAIGSGHVVSIGAFQAIEPGKIPDEVIVRHVPGLEKAYEEAKGKAAMRAPAFEDLQRFYNPELFAHRFTMLDEMGERARRFLTLSHLKDKGYDWKEMKVTKSPAWKELAHAHGMTEQDKIVRSLMETVEEDMGISFSQLLGPGFFYGGGDYDATSWRLEKGILDEIRQKYLDVRKQYPDGARLDNQALGIQLLVAGTKEEKMQILDRMMRRTPSKLFQIVTTERDRVFAKYHIDLDRDWKPLQRALSLAEMKAWEDETLATADVDFGRREDFAAHVVPFLRRLGVPEGRFADYHSAIREFQEALQSRRYMKKGDEGFKDLPRAKQKAHERQSKRIRHQTILEAIAEGKLPMTLSLSDFDWKDSNFFQLGAIAMDRRGRDNEAMAASRDIMNDLLFKTEFLSPNDPLETLKKIKELRNTVNTYATGDVAEQVSKEVLRVFLEMNRDRAIHSKWLAAFRLLPGSDTFMRYAGEIDLRKLEKHGIYKFIPGWDKLPHEKIAHLPHSIGEALSYSTRYTGAHGNAYDESQIAEILATAQDIGIFTAHPEYVNDLREEFKATFGWRGYRLFRKYWWVVLAATVALAAAKSIEDEQQRHT